MYGTVGAFAADILRHEFEKVDIRGGRRCDAIVVDEIDYMTLDQGTQVTTKMIFTACICIYI